MIFEDIQRDYHDPAAHREDEFSFLNRSARPAAAQVRSLIEQWAILYPPRDRDELKSALRSQFRSTFFEMFVHAMLKQFGCTVDVHPVLSNQRSTRPDFVATFPTGERVIVECAHPKDPSSYSKSEQARLDALYDDIERIRSANFFLVLHEIDGLKMRQPSIKRLRRYIEERISSLNVDDLHARVERGELNSMPTWLYEDGEFNLEFSVWPKSPGHRTARGAFIASYPSETRLGGHGNTLRSRIADKATKYGKLESPFVVAVNTGSLLATRVDDEMDALFGSERSLLRQENAIPTTGSGVWLGAGGPQNTRLSAVIFSRVFPWNLPVAPICIYHNPFATRPCVTLPWRLEQAVPVDGRMQWRPGSTIGSILDLPSDWPGTLFPLSGTQDHTNDGAALTG